VNQERWTSGEWRKLLNENNVIDFVLLQNQQACNWVVTNTNWKKKGKKKKTYRILVGKYTKAATWKKVLCEDNIKIGLRMYMYVGIKWM